MDGRERLRIYLEQRRELGERDLILDGLTVEDTLRIIGAAGAGHPHPARPEEKSRPADSSRPSDAPSWRDVLRAAPADGPRETAAPDLPDPRRTAPEQPRPPAGPGDPIAPPGLVVGSSARELFVGAIAGLASVQDIAAAVSTCTRCPLYTTATNPVPGEGSATARLLVCGEAPGASEDASGRPFVGPAGQLLTKILAAVQLAREDVFICNVLKHRPPGNRNPRPEEVAACSPFLVRQIDLIRPRAILALGTFAAQTLLETKLSIGKLRGQIHRYYGVPLVVTYHPAALLRNPAWKRPTWEDVQLARRILDSAIGGA